MHGQTGPDREKGGFDLIAQGVSGLMSVTGEPGGPPVKVGVPLTDLGAALFALSAVLAALHYRGRTGRGQYIDTSLVEAGIALVGLGIRSILRRGDTAAADGIGASPAGAVPGHPVCGRLHHAGRGQRPAVSAAVRAARTSGVGGRSSTTPTTRFACATVRASSRASKRSPPPEDSLPRRRRRRRRRVGDRVVRRHAEQRRGRFGPADVRQAILEVAGSRIVMTREQQHLQVR